MMDVLLQVVSRRLVFAVPLSGSLWWRDFLCFSPSLFLTTEVRLAIIGSCLQLGIDHLDRPSIPPFLLHPPRLLSPSFSLLASTSPPSPFPAVSLSALAAATLISMVNGVPSSVQTNSWIDRRVQTLSSLFPAQMAQNSNATRWKARGRDWKRERAVAATEWDPNIRNVVFSWDAAYLFYLLLCYDVIQD